LFAALGIAVVSGLAVPAMTTTDAEARVGNPA
jgi:hypothetical protein